MSKRFQILHRYLLREFLKIFSLSLSTLILIYTIVLFFQKVNLFIKHQAHVSLIFLYLLFKIPEIVFQWTLPYGILLSTLLTLGILSRHNELTAMKAGGVSLYRIVWPLFMVSLLVSFCSFLGNEYLVPLTNQKTRYLLSVQVRKQEATSFFKNYKIWYRSDQRIFNIQVLDSKEKVLKGVTFYQFDDQFRCVERVDAREVKWVDGKWKFLNGAIRKFEDDGTIRLIPFTEKEYSLPEDWYSFQNIERESKEMSYTDLRNYIQKIKLSGYDPTRYLVDLHAKLSYPFLNLVMVLIGIPFALRTGRSGGIALNIGMSVMIGFAYGITFYAFISLGKSGILPPLLSAWIPTLLFGSGGIFTLMSVRQ